MPTLDSRITELERSANAAQCPVRTTIRFVRPGEKDAPIARVCSSANEDEGVVWTRMADETDAALLERAWSEAPTGATVLFAYP